MLRMEPKWPDEVCREATRQKDSANRPVKMGDGVVHDLRLDETATRFGGPR